MNIYSVQGALAEPLLGAIPMEEMDVIIHPLRQEMMVNPEHPYYAQLKLKGFTKPGGIKFS
jgi:hypothetical protein